MKKTLVWSIDACGDEEYIEILQKEMDARFSLIHNTSVRNAKIKYRQLKNPYSKVNVRKLIEAQTLKGESNE